jgi:hypothetical protein
MGLGQRVPNVINEIRTQKLQNDAIVAKRFNLDILFRCASLLIRKVVA